MNVSSTDHVPAMQGLLIYFSDLFISIAHICTSRALDYNYERFFQNAGGVIPSSQQLRLAK